MTAYFCPDAIVWGDIATWFAGAGTILTAAIALYLARRSDIKEDHRKQRDRKEWIFSVLMANRRNRFSRDTLHALNSIDLAFGGGLAARSTSAADRVVNEKWQQILLHVAEDKRLPDGHPGIPAWNTRLDALYFELLHEMSKALGYAFELSELTRGGYFPESQGTADREGAAMRKAVLDVFQGTRPLKIIPTPPQDQ